MDQATYTKSALFGWEITRLEREIALLREYRTRLMADVVTGQLDVRPAEPSDAPPAADELADAETEEVAA